MLKRTPLNRAEWHRCTAWQLLSHFGV